MWPFLGLGAEPEFGNDEAVVCPAHCAAHALRDSYILPVPLPHDDVIYEMPVFWAGMHPRRPLTGREVEDGVGDQKVMFHAGLDE